MPPLRILSRADVEAAVDMPTAIATVRRAFVELSTGQAHVPLRTAIPVSPDATSLVMPAYLGGSGGLGLKVVNVYPGNIARGLPLIHALVIVLDAATGAPVAALEGGGLTALRTGAASGVATDLLAWPDARRLTVFGAGTQAEPQALAVCAVRPIERVTIVSTMPGSAQALAERLAGQPTVPPAIDIVDNPALAVADADIICTATTSPTPVFPAKALPDGVHINAIGAFTPITREIPGEVVARARIVVDQRVAAEAEAGDLVIPWRAGESPGPAAWTEIGLIAAGRAPGRQSREEITLFKSVGNAVQDIAVAALAVQRAAERGLGTVVEL